MSSRNYIGATYLGKGRCRFRVWAPFAAKVEVHLLTPRDLMVPLEKGPRGYHTGVIEGVEPGALYLYRLDGTKERPDPASRHQPQGVHGPSEVTESDFVWQNGNWSGITLRDYILYELHVGTFTREGTFEAILPHVDELQKLGVTAVELMPAAQFPGDRNWGYDGVYPYAVQSTYGGPEGLKRLVDALHGRGLAVVLDVVYNHLGPEGNYLWDYGPYFTDRYKTPWGPAINFDGPYADEVRSFFVGNALYWVTELRIDALRIDAIHGIFDFSSRHFLEEVGTAVHDRGQELNRRIHVIPESDLNDVRAVRPPELGGYGLDAQWNDDFHHAVHTLVTEERSGYYEDFGRIEHLEKAFREGFIYSGQYSPYRKRRHGRSSVALPAERFVVFIQNHDQVGNRVLGERLSASVPFEALKLVAGVVLFSPFIPLLFMGEEYGETAGFAYFVSHSDPDLVEAVRKGRKDEFAAFSWAGEPPDPQDPGTFMSAKLNHEMRRDGHHRVLYEFYREVIGLRKEINDMVGMSKERQEVRGFEREKILLVRRWSEEGDVTILYHFGDSPQVVTIALPPGQRRKRLDSADPRWHGPGSAVPEELSPDGEVQITASPLSAVVFTQVEKG